jgi:acyl CoA:acetate/3-ketoacid CoA transferase alpha subunit
MANKVVPLEELCSLVGDGTSVALGGGWFANHPMAAVRELIRGGRSGLHAICVAGSIEADLLVAAGALSHLSFSMVTLGSFGLAPNVRRGIEEGTLGFTEYTGLGLLIGLEASGRGVPYLPYRGPFGSEIPAHYPEIYASVSCPFTGEELTAVSALSPDVAIVHALRSDDEGNAQWDGTTGPDVELAKAAKRVIVTCEEIVPRDVLVANPHMTKLPGFYVEAVIEAPFGAHPTSHVPRYASDSRVLLDYARIAGGEGIHALVHELRGENEAAYRKRLLGSGRADVLAATAREARVLG